VRRRRDEIETAIPPGSTFAELEWRLAWRPMLATVGLVAACMLIPLVIAWIIDAQSATPR
jgi:hypothetical protein